jgi:type I restriction enzyme S subunit
MSAYRPYPKYKVSGVEWLGGVPEGWEVKPLKVIASFNDDVLSENFAEDEEIEYVDIGSVSLETGIERTETFRFGDAPSRARRRVRDGDVIASTVRTYLKAIAPVVVPPANLIVSTGFAVIRPRNGLDSHFAKFSLQSGYFVDEVISRSTGVSYPAINASEMAAISLALPPLPEQVQIAAFLDRECGKLDALQAKQERLIGLLKEKRQALISHAVTRGLDPTAKLKPSGIEWLGEVPAHWTVPQLGKKITLQRGYDITKDLQTEGNVPVVSSGGISSYHDTAPCSGPGVVVGRKGSAGAIHWIDCPYWPHDTTLFVSEFKKNLPRFVYYKLLSMDLIGFDTGSANPTLNRNNIHPELVSWPSSVAEQTAIVAHLDEKCGKIDQLKAKAERGIALLKERRSALISAAVTGKIDVRDHLPQSRP